MQATVERYFWLVLVLTIGGCALFAAKLANHLIEDRLMTDAVHGPSIARAAAPMVTAPVDAKDGQPIVERNMFCSDCGPPPAPTDPPVVPVDPRVVPLTALPLRLVATHVGGGRHGADASQAFVLNTADQRQGAYRVGHQLPGGGPVVAIAAQYVDFDNRVSHRKERISLVGAAPPTVAQVRSAPDRRDQAATAFEAGIRKVDDHTFVIDRPLVETMLVNPMALAKDARVTPSSTDGKPDGFRVSALRPGSALARVGLANGDTIRAINGLPLDSMDKVLAAVAALRDADRLQIDLTRQGKPVTLSYTIQ